MWLMGLHDQFDSGLAIVANITFTTVRITTT
jgi:hypothetical protein